MNDSDLSMRITAYGQALQHSQSAVALLYLHEIMRAVYTGLYHDPWLHRDVSNREPDRTIVPMITAWTEHVAACCAPEGAVVPADDAAHANDAARLVQHYRSAWGYTTPDQPDDDHIFGGLINCLGRPLAGVTGCIELFRRCADSSRLIEHDMASLIRLSTLWSEVWQAGLTYAQNHCPGALDQELLPRE
jgi:hypothetical protein